MLSETARATTVAESRYRVQTPNAMPRRILVVALDPATAALGQHLAEERWRNIRFANFEVADPQKNLTFTRLGADEDSASDVIVMVGTVGRDLRQANRIAERCARLGTQVSGVLIAPKRAKPAAVKESLLALRPMSRTLALIRDGEFLRDILQALGACLRNPRSVEFRAED